MTLTAFSLFDDNNLVPIAPFGVSGALKGAAPAFFGYLGFDEVMKTPFPERTRRISRKSRTPCMGLVLLQI